eukprot:6102378-Amphidinium_carterae.1
MRRSFALMDLHVEFKVPEEAHPFALHMCVHLGTPCMPSCTVAFECPSILLLDELTDYTGPSMPLAMQVHARTTERNSACHHLGTYTRTPAAGQGH